MYDEDLLLASAAFIVISSSLKKKKRRRWWVSKFLKKRSSQNAVVFLNELKSQSEDGRFHNFCRCNQEDFERLLILIQVKIGKKNTNCREAISPRQKLAVTLRYLATGDSYASLMFFFRISKSAISKNQKYVKL